MSFRKVVSLANLRIGRAAGCAVARFPLQGSLDAELALLLRTFDIDQVLDVGAHQGQFALGMRRGGFDGSIVSFEPAAPAYRVLHDTAASDPRWSTQNVALGRHEGTSELHVFDGTQFNSFRDLSAHAPNFSPNLAVATTESVQVRRLDAVADELGVDLAHTLLKIDTQGFDMEVVAGAGDRIAEIPAILTEVAVEPLYAEAPRFEVVVADLRDLGFELTGAFPLHRYGTAMRVIEFDCTFVNVRRSPAPPTP